MKEALERGDSLKAVLTMIIEEGKQLVEAESCSVVLLDQRNKWSPCLVFFSTGGKQAQSVEETSFPADKGIVGAVVTQGKSELVNDVSGDPRFYPEVERTSGLKTHSIMSAPLRLDGEVIGAINMLNKKGGFTEKDLNLLREFVLFAGRPLGESRRLADELRSGWFLSRKADATISHLTAFHR